MGLESYFRVDGAAKRVGNLEEWVKYNVEYIYYLHDRIDELEKEISKLKKHNKKKRRVGN
jgi:glycerol-3-phosphate responsive antiterminator